MQDKPAMTEKPDYMQKARESFAHFSDEMDDAALIRWREHALEGRGHDMAEANKNSLRRIITRLDRAEAALDTERAAHEATKADRDRYAGLLMLAQERQSQPSEASMGERLWTGCPERECHPRNEEGRPQPSRYGCAKHRIVPWRFP